MILSISKLDSKSIYDLLKRVDSIFKPMPLSCKVNLLLYSQKLSENALHIGVYDDNSLIGMTCFYMNDILNKRIFISITCIDPRYTGKGLGSKLTKMVEDFGLDNNYCIVDFEVEKENLPSINMHKKIGYSILETNENGNYIMRKVL